MIFRSFLMRILIAAALTLALPTGLLAAGGNDKPDETKCPWGKVYDKEAKECVAIEKNSLDTDARYEAVRRLAHAGRYTDAQMVLAQMPQDDDRTLTYLGFTNRKMGHTDIAMQYYTQALTVNPANILARSYMGQGLVEQGKIADALVQLRAIRVHGGDGTWAEASLRTAIATGQTYTY
jgi:tetratricopeptide (TPR) repeat protein